MKILIQRVNSAFVKTAASAVVASIQKGLCVSVGLHKDDSEEVAQAAVKKILSLKLFESAGAGPSWARTVQDIEGDILVISNFTLCTAPGKKLSFSHAMKPEPAHSLFSKLLDMLRASYTHERVVSSVFGEYCSVVTENDGPTTLFEEITIPSSSASASTTTAPTSTSTSTSSSQPNKKKAASITTPHPHATAAAAAAVPLAAAPAPLPQELQEKTSSPASSALTLRARPQRASITAVEEKIQLVKQVGEEIVQEQELEGLFLSTPHPVCYDGFEPSGRVHIAQGVLRSINVNRMIAAGCNFVFWVADWFAMMNNKMDGDLNKIRTVGLYMIEVWKACGMDLTHVEFKWASEEINKDPHSYWLRVIDVARKFNVPRIKRCAQIMGRKEEEDLSAAQIMYPCMQCADIFFLKADICQLGMDQRKVNMLAREYCAPAGIERKPIIVAHHMIMGLKEGQEKMSKSDPDSAIFMEDSESEVNAKIQKAFCPPKCVEKNPIFDYLQHIIFQAFNEIIVERDAHQGGTRVYTSYTEMVADYEQANLHPADVKKAVAKYINLLIQPVRDHFENDKRAHELMQTVKMYKTTR